MKKILLCLIVLIQVCLSVSAFYENTDYDVGTEEIVSFNLTNNKLNINAKNAILYDRTYKRILYSKNIDEKVPNASTTKMLTAIVAYENGNMDDIVTISSKSANIGGSCVKFRTGDKITLGDLMKGLLLCSGNDAAVAIAEHIAGTEETFCKMLNEKAEEIGAYNTNFVSPHGLDDEEHYSTAYDLAIIADYALNIDYIAEIVSKQTANIKINDYTRIINTTNEMLSTYRGADGVKTGYTSKAGRCLVTSACRNGRRLVSVVLRCDTKKDRTIDSINLLDYGFNNFKIFDVASIINKKYSIMVDKSQNGTYFVAPKIDCILPLSEEEIENLSIDYQINSHFVSPLPQKTQIGEIVVSIGENELKRFKICTDVYIERMNMLDYIKMLVINAGKYLKI